MKHTYFVTYNILTEPQADDNNVTNLIQITIYILMYLSLVRYILPDNCLNQTVMIIRVGRKEIGLRLPLY